MKRWLILRRARRSCDRATSIYDIARRWIERGDFCEAGRCKALADVLAGYALDDLEAAEPYLPAEVRP